MQRIEEIMTRELRTISPQDSIRKAAEIMKELNVGAIPVCDGDRLVGIVTDRDIAVRAVADSETDDNAAIGQIMSTQLQTCFDNEVVDEVMERMRDSQVRRVPVLDHRSRALIGIVSLGDLATKHSAEVDHTLERISTPSAPQLD